MENLEFDITIAAPVQKVWHYMFHLDWYKQRSHVFNPAWSWYEGDRSEWSTMRFLWPNPPNHQEIWGMECLVAQNIMFEILCLNYTNEIISWWLKPLEWDNGTENYYFSYSDWVTHLRVTINNIPQNFCEYAEKLWPQALDIIKKTNEIPYENIKIQATIDAPLDMVREAWTSPLHIVKRNAASADRHTTHATNDLRTWWRFLSHMEAKDWSFGFDFTWTYTQIINQSTIEYVMDDGRNNLITFEQWQWVHVVSVFDAETQNSKEMQQQWRQSILDNFKYYVENLG